METGENRKQLEEAAYQYACEVFGKEHRLKNFFQQAMIHIVGFVEKYPSFFKLTSKELQEAADEYEENVWQHNEIGTYESSLVKKGFMSGAEWMKELYLLNEAAKQYRAGMIHENGIWESDIEALLERLEDVYRASFTDGEPEEADHTHAYAIRFCITEIKKLINPNKHENR
jgi:hypothetical protein